MILCFVSRKNISKTVACGVPEGNRRWYVVYVELLIRAAINKQIICTIC